MIETRSFHVLFFTREYFHEQPPRRRVFSSDVARRLAVAVDRDSLRNEIPARRAIGD